MSAGMSADPWTPERDAKLRELWDQGLSASEIGEQLRRPKNSIIGRAHRLHLAARVSPILAKGSGKTPLYRARPRRAGRTTLPSWGEPIQFKAVHNETVLTPEAEERFKVMWLEGAATRVIGGELGFGKDAVSRKAERLGLPPRGVRRFPERVAVAPVVRPKPPARQIAPAVSAVPPDSPQAADVDIQPSTAAGGSPALSAADAAKRTSRMCCWPLWGMSRPTHRYCDAEVKPGKVYCPQHAARCYVPWRPSAAVGEGTRDVRDAA